MEENDRLAQQQAMMLRLADLIVEQRAMNVRVEGFMERQTIANERQTLTNERLALAIDRLALGQERQEAMIQRQEAMIQRLEAILQAIKDILGRGNGRP